MYTVEHWYISGVLTGYRVLERGVRGHLTISRGFTGDIYKPGSFDQALNDAKAHCDQMNKPYKAPNVIQLRKPLPAAYLKVYP